MWARSVHSSFIGNDCSTSPSVPGKGRSDVHGSSGKQEPLTAHHQSTTFGSPEEAYTPPVLRNRVSLNLFVLVVPSMHQLNILGKQIQPGIDSLRITCGYES